MANEEYDTFHGSNALYLTQAEGNKVALASADGHELYFPQTGEVRFIGYYPYNEDIETIEDAYPITLGNQSDTAPFDLLWYKDTTDAGLFNKDIGNPSIDFKHQLSKIVVNLYLDNGMEGHTIESAKLANIPTTALFNLQTSEITGHGNTDDVDFITSDLTTTDTAAGIVQRFEAIIVPHGGEETGFISRVMAFTILDPLGETMTLSWEIQDDRTFETNKLYTYNFTLTHTAVDFMGVTINDWTSTEINQNLESDNLRLSDYECVLTMKSYTKTLGIKTSHSDIPELVSSEDWLTITSIEKLDDRYIVIYTVASKETGGNRTATITATVGKMTAVCTVSQFNDNPMPASFTDVPAAGTTGNAFTITTDMLDEDITVTTTDANIITNLTKSRSTVNSAGFSVWTITFDVSANPAYSPRSGEIEVTINGITKTASISQLAYTPVSEANSYIVLPATGGIQFNPTRAKAYGSASGTSAYIVKTLWDDTGCINTPTIDSGIGDAAIITVVPTGTAGNAVIAVYEGTTIVWSYHIWVVDYDPENGGSTFTNTFNTNKNGSNFVFMDRNLGATKVGLGSGLGTGLFYQWGRKDPFPATLEAGETQAGGGSFTVVATNATVGNVANTIKNPTVFYWAVSASAYDWHYAARDYTLWAHGNTTAKSVYDPCPVGWRVPSHNVASGAPTSDVDSPWAGFLTLNGGTFSDGYTWGASAAYPATGYRDTSSGALLSVGSNGYYWTASPYGSTSSSSVLYFYSNIVGSSGSYGRAGGNPVRCVRE